jgi:hypothetical protein
MIMILAKTNDVVCCCCWLLVVGCWLLLVVVVVIVVIIVVKDGASFVAVVVFDMYSYKMYFQSHFLASNSVRRYSRVHMC